MRITSAITGIGKLGNMNLFYDTQTGNYYARLNGGMNKSQYYNSPDCVIVRKNLSEFSICPKSSAFLRSGTSKIRSYIVLSARFFGYSTALFKNSILTYNTPSDDLGKRTLQPNQTPSIFEGFELNLQYNLADCLIISPHSSLYTGRSVVRVWFDNIAPADLIPPSGATHWRIFYSACIIPSYFWDSNINSYSMDSVLKGQQRIYTGTTLTLATGLSKTYQYLNFGSDASATDSIFVFAGIKYYTHIFGIYTPIPANCALKLIDVY